MGYYQRLKDLKEDKELTQKEIAELLYMQREVYRRYETGQREIPFDIVIKLADYYNVSLDYIAGRTNNKRGIGFADSFRGNINIDQQNNNFGNGTQINVKK